jgi:hypothetical protein
MMSSDWSFGFSFKSLRFCYPFLERGLDFKERLLLLRLWFLSFGRRPFALVLTVLDIDITKLFADQHSEQIVGIFVVETVFHDHMGVDSALADLMHQI